MVFRCRWECRRRRRAIWSSILRGRRRVLTGPKRAGRGHAEPWTSVFPTIHLELGNEAWNQGTFYGSTVGDPAVFGSRAQEIFRAARSSPSYIPAKFDLVLGTFTEVPWWTEHEIAGTVGYDSVAIAPYLFNTFNDTSSNESIFGPMFAQPEMMDSVGSGLVQKQAAAVRTGGHATKLNVYEVNLGTASGTATQPADRLDRAIGCGRDHGGRSHAIDDARPRDYDAVPVRAAGVQQSVPCTDGRAGDYAALGGRNRYGWDDEPSASAVLCRGDGEPGDSSHDAHD